MNKDKQKIIFYENISNYPMIKMNNVSIHYDKMQIYNSYLFLYINNLMMGSIFMPNCEFNYKAKMSKMVLI